MKNGDSSVERNGSISALVTIVLMLSNNAISNNMNRNLDRMIGVVTSRSQCGDRYDIYAIFPAIRVTSNPVMAQRIIGSVRITNGVGVPDYYRHLGYEPHMMKTFRS